MTYTYDNWHNVKTATTAEGLLYTFTYDAYGNNTKVQITGSGLTISSSAAYTADYNRIASVTDALGKITRYSYNENTNVLEWVQYPEDSETTRTNYTYDAMYRALQVTSTLNSSTALTVSYGYTDDYLTSMTTGSTTYGFTYGTFGLRSAVKIGSRTLASYTYTSDRNFYLSQLTYGNQDKVTYTYDDLGRVTKETFEDGDTVTYAYDNTGALATVTDSATGRTTTYYYDFTDRLMKYQEKGVDYSHSVGYTYDNINNLTAMVETINGTARTTFYAYDDDNRVTSVSTNGVSRTYTYDAWGSPLATTGDLATTLGTLNPLRYRGYIYDTETGLYYLQSRYYDPEVGRFINADVLVSTGQGILGNNMFAYCNNNPTNYSDPSGNCARCLANKRSNRFSVYYDDCLGGAKKLGGKITLARADTAYTKAVRYIMNDDEQAVLDAEHFAFYKGHLVIRTNGKRSGSFGILFITRETNSRPDSEDVIRHEYGHTQQMNQLGIIKYALCIFVPSWLEWGNDSEYYRRPWEITADIYGGVQSRCYPGYENAGFEYLDNSGTWGIFAWLTIK